MLRLRLARKPTQIQNKHKEKTTRAKKERKSKYAYNKSQNNEKRNTQKPLARKEFEQRYYSAICSVSVFVCNDLIWTKSGLKKEDQKEKTFLHKRRLF